MGCLCDQICQIEALKEVMEDDGVWMMWVVHMDIKINDIQSVTGFINFLFNYLQKFIAEHNYTAAQKSVNDMQVEVFLSIECF